MEKYNILSKFLTARKMDCIFSQKEINKIALYFFAKNRKIPRVQKYKLL